MKQNKTTAVSMYLIVLLFLGLTAINPHDYFTWVLEVSWVIIGMVILIRLNLKGTTVTWLLAISLFIHSLILIYGGWYTYENVPLGFWMQDTFGFERNHYDRIGHFVQGLFPAILYREVLIRKNVVDKPFWREFIVFGFVMAFTALFELLEFGAALAFGQGADAFLGSQGDVWDAQWDMFLCGIGGLLSIVFLSKLHEAQIQKMTIQS